MFTENEYLEEEELAELHYKQEQLNFLYNGVVFYYWNEDIENYDTFIPSYLNWLH